jgi:hypothetical protein
MKTDNTIKPNPRTVDPERRCARADSVGRRVALTLILFAGAIPAAQACIFTYTLVGGDGAEVRIRPDEVVTLTEGASYRIDIAMREDHGVCRIEPEDTMFLLDEARWRANRDTQPFLLTSEIVWEKVGSRSYTTSLSFVAIQSGDRRIDIIRECTRGGSHETLLFEVM